MNWQPIETAPKDGTVVDLWVPHKGAAGKRVTDAFYVHNSYRLELVDESQRYTGGAEWRNVPHSGWKVYDYEYNEDVWCGEPSHWMPLPRPPGVCRSGKDDGVTR